MNPTAYRYFAYGSNMLTRRLIAADRAPSARPIGIGYVEGRRLTFNKASEDGSGKCDAEATGKPSDRVYGVMFEIAVTDKAALDKAESLGVGYREEYVEVVTGTGAVTLHTYIAIKKGTGLRPYHWYKAIVVAGAVEHGLSNDYVEWLKAVESIEDPNAERRAKHEVLLAAG